MPMRARAIAEGVDDADERRAKTFVLVFLILGGSSIAGMLTLNWAVDPRGEFGTGWIPPLTVNSAPEKAAAYLARGGADAIVLGSSHSMRFDATALAGPDGSAYNLAFQGASAGDALAMLRLTLDRPQPPRDVVYGLSLRELGGAPGATWRVRAPPIAEYAPPEPPLHVATVLATLDQARYTRDSLRSIRNVLTHSEAARTPTLDERGIHHPIQEALEAEGTWKLDPNALASDIAASLLATANVEGVDPGSIQTVREMSIETLAHGSRFHVFLAPVHPDLLAGFEARGDGAREEMRVALIGICAPGVHVYDFMDIESFAGNETSFSDASHVLRANADLVIAAIAQSRADLCAT